MSAGIQIPTQLGLSVSAQSASGPTQVSLGSSSRNYVSSFNKSAAKASSLAALSRTLNEQEQLLNKQQDRLTKEEARLGAALGADPEASVDDAKTRAAQDAFLNIRGRLWAEKRAQEILSQEGGGASGQAEALARGLSKTDLANTPFVDGAVPTLLGAISAARNKDAAEARKAAAEAKEQSASDYTDLMVREARAANGDPKKLGAAWSSGIQNLRGLGLTGKQINSLLGDTINTQLQLAKTPAERASIMSAFTSARPNGVPSIADSLPGGQLMAAKIELYNQQLDERYEAEAEQQSAKLRGKVELELTDMLSNGVYNPGAVQTEDDLLKLVPDAANLNEQDRLSLLVSQKAQAERIQRDGLVKTRQAQDLQAAQNRTDFMRGIPVDVDNQLQAGLIDGQQAAEFRTFRDHLASQTFKNATQDFFASDAEISKFALGYRQTKHWGNDDQGRRQYSDFVIRVGQSWKQKLDAAGLVSEVAPLDWSTLDKKSPQYATYRKLFSEALVDTSDTGVLSLEDGIKTMLQRADVNIADPEMNWDIVNLAGVQADPKRAAAIDQLYRSAVSRSSATNQAAARSAFEQALPQGIQANTGLKGELSTYFNERFSRELAANNIAAAEAVRKSTGTDIATVDKIAARREIDWVGTAANLGLNYVKGAVLSSKDPKDIFAIKSPSAPSVESMVFPELVDGRPRPFLSYDNQVKDYRGDLGTILLNRTSSVPGQVSPELVGLLKQAYVLEEESSTVKKMARGELSPDTMSEYELRVALNREKASKEFTKYFNEQFMGPGAKYFIKDDEKKTFVPNPAHPYWKQNLNLQ